MATLLGIERTNYLKKERGQNSLFAEELVNIVKVFNKRLDPSDISIFLDSIFDLEGDLLLKDKYIKLLEEKIASLEKHIEELEGKKVDQKDETLL